MSPPPVPRIFWFYFFISNLTDLQTLLGLGFEFPHDSAALVYRHWLLSAVRRLTGDPPALNFLGPMFLLILAKIEFFHNIFVHEH